MLKSGVYSIYCKPEDKYYYGSSKNLVKRLTTHKRELKNNIHFNWKLQKAWNDHGEGSFTFKIENKCPVEYRKKLEQKYLDTFLKAQEAISKVNNDFFRLGYNLSPDVNSIHNLNSINSRKKFKEGVKSKLYKVGRKPFTIEESINQSKIKSKPILQYSLNGTFIKEFKSIKEASETLNIKTNHIGQVCRKKLRAAKGYIFRYKNDLTKLNLPINYKQKERDKKVGIYNTNNKLLRTFDSLKDCSEELNYKKSTIKSNIHKNFILNKKYYFNFIK